MKSRMVLLWYFILYHKTEWYNQYMISNGTFGPTEIGVEMQTFVNLSHKDNGKSWREFSWKSDARRVQFLLFIFVSL